MVDTVNPLNLDNTPQLLISHTQETFDVKNFALFTHRLFIYNFILLRKGNTNFNVINNIRNNFIVSLEYVDL